MENFIGNLNENQENLFFNEKQRILAENVGFDGVLYDEPQMLDEELICVSDDGVVCCGDECDSRGLS